MSKKTKKLPFISFIIPTLNSGRYLSGCLNSIKKQDYPKGKVEILIIDGGSKDRTIKISKKFKTKILNNPDVDAESGKSIGIKKAKGEIICLLDSDNEIVQKDWLGEMVKPMVKHKDLWGAESPWLLNKDDNLINKYFTLLQVADPVARRFHPVRLKERQYQDYVILEPKNKVPIIGANGFLWRKEFIKQIGKHVPKFEEVNYVSLMMKGGRYKYAKLKGVGIYHHYTDTVSGYIKKRLKIGRKFLERKSKRQPTWIEKVGTLEFVKSVLFNATLIGPLIEGIKMFGRTKEKAWLLHPVFSLLTVLVYLYTTVEFLLRSILKPKTGLFFQSKKYLVNSKAWRQEVYYPTKVEWTEKALGVPFGGRVLDTGCGDGTMLKLFKEKKPFIKPFGIDISKESCDKASRKGITTQVVDLNKEIPFKDDYFDFIISHKLIEHLVDPDNFLKECNRVLKKNGFLILVTPNLTAWYQRFLFLLGFPPTFIELSTKDRTVGIKKLGFVKNKKPVGHIRVFTVQALRDLLKLYGFKVKSVKGLPVAFAFPGILSLFYDTLDFLFSYIPSFSSNILIVAKNTKK